jgi:hypothetical protein
MIFPLTELLDRREMGYFIEMNLLPDKIHVLGEFNGIPIIFSKVLFQEKENE